MYWIVLICIRLYKIISTCIYIYNTHTHTDTTHALGLCNHRAIGCWPNPPFPGLWPSILRRCELTTMEAQCQGNWKESQHQWLYQKWQASNSSNQGQQKTVKLSRCSRWRPSGRCWVACSSSSPHTKVGFGRSIDLEMMVQRQQKWYFLCFSSCICMIMYDYW